MRRAIEILILILLSSCSTRFIMPTLPDFNPIKPTRPILQEVEGNVPMGAVLNTISLMDYAEQLELYGKSWEDFYSKLQEDFSDGEI